MLRSGRYANVVATLALFVALGGTSYAAVRITGGTADSDDRDVVTLTGAGALASAGTAMVVCRTNAVNGNWLARSISGVQVSSINGG
jgi:hypothetical protein